MFTDKTNADIKRYLTLKKLVKEAETELDDLKAPVLEALLNTPTGRKTIIKGQDGSLTIMVRKTWHYPPVVESLKDEYDRMKKESEQTGAATFDEQETLMLKSTKP